MSVSSWWRGDVNVSLSRLFPSFFFGPPPWFGELLFTNEIDISTYLGMWQTDLADQCLIRGQGVLDQYGYKPGYMGKDVGIMMGIIVGYRIAGWIVLKLKR